jgi:hypothetical protein
LYQPKPEPKHHHPLADYECASMDYPQRQSCLYWRYYLSPLPGRPKPIVHYGYKHGIWLYRRACERKVTLSLGLVDCSVLFIEQRCPETSTSESRSDRSMARVARNVMSCSADLFPGKESNPRLGSKRKNNSTIIEATLCQQHVHGHYRRILYIAYWRSLWHNNWTNKVTTKTIDMICSST